MPSPCLMTDWAEELAFVLSNEQTRQQKHWHFKWGHGRQNLSLRLNPLFVMSQGLGCTEFYGYTFRSFEKWDNQVACGLEMVQTLWVLFRKDHELLKTPRSELLHCICNPALWGPLLFLVVYSAGHALFLTQWWMFHYIYITHTHTHHITVVSHKTCLLSGPGYDDSLYFFYINRQESQPSNAWFWALHGMLWHLPKQAKISPSCAGTIEDGTGVARAVHWAVGTLSQNSWGEELAKLIGILVYRYALQLPWSHRFCFWKAEGNKSTFCNLYLGDEYLTGN